MFSETWPLEFFRDTFLYVPKLTSHETRHSPPHTSPLRREFDRVETNLYIARPCNLVLIKWNMVTSMNP